MRGMAQLIQLRQRIKAIETIKKITHAMRLISMSNHSRLKSKQEPLQFYTDALRNLFYTIKAQNPTWHNPVLYPASTEPKPLTIVVGSQKGLCGNFNASVFKLFESYIKSNHLTNNHYIIIGKKADDYLHDHIKKFPGIIVNHYDEFSGETLFSIAQAIAQEILLFNKDYTQVTFISNKSKSFFSQKPQAFKLIPFSPSEESAKESKTEDYVWEQSPLDLLDSLAHQYIEAAIQTLLFQSLLAEQAARFLSMDTSTRNAQTLLEVTELQYNKLRQSKITKELTELTGSI